MAHITAQQTEELTRLLNTPEAARFLSVSKRTLQELASERKIAQIKFGRNVRYSIADLEAFIDANRNKALGWKGATR
jgi:excisionase family DNA binding protein